MASIDRIQRLLRFVELLQSGRQYNSSLLAEICEVSRRTVFRDIRTLRDFGLGVRYDQERGGYHLPACSSQLTTDVLQDELMAVFILCSTLDDAQEVIPFIREARSAVGKLAASQTEQHRNELYRAAEVISIQIAPSSVLPSDSLNFRTVMRAAMDRQCVRIGYEDFSTRQTVTTLFSPYRLVFRGRSWSVVGRSSIHRAIRTIDILQFLHLEMTDRHFQIPHRFNLDRYLRYSWHLKKEGGRRDRVVVRFQATVAADVARSRWHPTQHIVWNSDGTIDFQVTIDGLYEIERWVLGFGSDAEVLQPARLREMLAEQSRQISRLYRGTSTRNSCVKTGRSTRSKRART